MRRFLTAGVMSFLLATFGAIAAQAGIQGDYVEVRSADIYAGACYANSEVGLVGNEAILAWKVNQGDWNGTDLSGLSVVAVVRAKSTLGDPYHDPLPAKTVMILDERASGQQREALQSFARAMAGPLVENVVRIDTAPISFAITGDVSGAQAKLTAGNFATIETRALCHGDHMCGNEFVYYPPLTQISGATPAFTIEESFKGQGLDTVWKRADKRSAFVGTFAR